MKPELSNNLKSHGNDCHYIGQRNQNYHYPYSVLKHLISFLRIYKRRQQRHKEGNHLQNLFRKPYSNPKECSNQLRDGNIFLPNSTNDGCKKQNHYHCRHKFNNPCKFLSLFQVLSIIIKIFISSYLS